MGCTVLFIITHTLAPVIIAASAEMLLRDDDGAAQLGRRELVGIGVAGALPDLLSPHLSLAARYSSLSHTLWFFLLTIPLAWLLARLVYAGQTRLMAGLLVGAVALHLFCDGIAGGIAWGYPWVDGVVGSYLVPPVVWLPLELVSIVLLFLVVRWRSRPALA